MLQFLALRVGSKLVAPSNKEQKKLEDYLSKRMKIFSDEIQKAHRYPDHDARIDKYFSKLSVLRHRQRRKAKLSKVMAEQKVQCHVKYVTRYMCLWGGGKQGCYTSRKNCYNYKGSVGVGGHEGGTHGCCNSKRMQERQFT
jgi:hypothetical protein